MDSFRTTIPFTKAPFRLTHDDHIALIGSCFTEHLGKCLSDARFEALMNPNGVVYNPVSIGRCVERLLRPEPYVEEELFPLNELWHSWDHHGRFSAPTAAETVTGIQSSFVPARELLTGRCTCLMLTLGSAQVHQLVDTGLVVANNHKAPATWFSSRRLSVQEVVDSIAPAIEALSSLRPGLNVVLTVSPVRHVRQGMIENQRSKASLMLACAELEKRFANAWYFPAYELLLDDLRDYRFYASDLLHPSESALQYIWAFFQHAFFDDQTQELVARLEKLHRAVQHRPFHPRTQMHRRFCAALLAEIDDIQLKKPNIDLSEAKRHFEQYLNE